MRILHTADWHLGHRLHEQSQYDEQSRFLDWLVGAINTHQIDVLLVSGDIFDTGAPSSQSLRLYYNFLVNLKTTHCSHVVITGGNHDAPGTLNAPKALLQTLSVHVVGKATDDFTEEVIQLSVKDEQVIIAAVPYLRDQDIRRALAGESFEQIGDRYKKALVNHYQGVAEACLALKPPGIPIIAMGHLFAIGGSTSDSEQSIYVGNLGDIGADDFPEIFDYIALGHLHRPQVVGGKEHIRYSGTPYTLSFSEVGHSKQVLVVHTEGADIKEIEAIPTPVHRIIKRLEGTLEECLAQLQTLHDQQHDLTPWVEIVLNNASSVGFNEVQQAAQNLNVSILKVSLKSEHKLKGLETMVEAHDIKALTPLDVFEMKCKEQDFNLEEHQEIRDAFNEALQMAREGHEV